MTTGKTIALTTQTVVSRVISLLFNTVWVSRERLYSQAGVLIRIKAVTVFIPSAKFQKGPVADKIRVCAGS